MKKLLRILGITLLLVLVVLIALPFFLKDQIAEEVKKLANEQLNAQVDFSDVSLSFFRQFPKLTIDLDSLVISNKAPFEGVDLVRAESISASVNALSAMGNNIKILNVEVIRPDIDVRVLKDGTANYNILKEDSSAVAAETTEGSSQMGANLKNYEIKNANITYIDSSLNYYMFLKDLTHQGSGDFGADQFTLKTSTTASSVDVEFDGVKYLREVNTEIDADLDMDLANMKFTIGENRTVLNDLTLQAEGWIAMPEDDIDMDVKFNSKDTEFRSILSMVPAEFAKDLEGVDADGSMSVTGFVQGKYNETTMPGFSLDIKVKDGRFKYPDLPQSADNIQVDAHVSSPQASDLDGMKLEVRKFHVELAKNPFDATLALTHPISDPNIDCSVQGQLDLSSIKDVIPLEQGDDIRGNVTTDFKLKGKLSDIENERYKKFEASGQAILQKFLFHSEAVMYDMDIDVAYFNFNPAYLEVSQFKGKIGRSDLEMAGNISNYISYFLSDTCLTGNFDFKSKLLDLNEFMEEEAIAGADGTSAEEEPLSVVRIPNDINFHLNARVDKVLYDNLEMNNAVGSVQIDQGTASMRGLKIDLLDGNVTIDGSYDTRQENPIVDFTLDVKSMNIKKTAEFLETVEDMAPIAKKCKGTFSSSMSFKTSLNSQMEPIYETISGKGKMFTESVTVEDFEPLNKLASTLGIDRLAKQSIEDSKLSFRIVDGKAIVDPFTIKLGGITTTLYGSTSLLDQGIAYQADMDVPYSMLGSALGKQSQSLVSQFNSKFGTNVSAGTSIPVKVLFGGTVTKPKLETNYGEVAGDAVKNIVEEAKEEVIANVKEEVDKKKQEAIAKARAEADKIIADAQKQADSVVAEARNQADKVRSEGYKQAQDVEDSAKNFLEKTAKKIAADELRKKTDQSADKIISEAQKNADKIMASARENADAKIKSVE